MNFRRHHSSRAIAGMVTLALFASALPADAVKFPATANRGAPARTAGGGVRGDTCTAADNVGLTAIVPTNNVITTTKDNPTLFFFVPPAADKSAEVTLMNSNGDDIYQQTVALPKTAGILRVQFPEKTKEGTPLLTTGSTYTWRFSVICDASDRTRDLVIEGLVERVPVDSKLESALKQTKPESAEQAEVYAQAGIWQETVAIAAKLHKSQPATWNSLLKSVGLESLAKAPLVD